MTTETTPESNPLFQQLTAMLATSALQHLGVLPGAEEQDSDLETASMTIDMLDMLSIKTKGNLSAEEDQMLSESLASLKMAFVQVQTRGNAPPEAPSEERSPGEEPQTTTEEAAADIAMPDAAAEEKQPKFHKRYD